MKQLFAGLLFSALAFSQTFQGNIRVADPETTRSRTRRNNGPAMASANLRAIRLTASALAAAWMLSGQIVEKNQGYLPFADAPINYRSENLSDPVAKLQAKLDRGDVELDFEQGHGYLKAVLVALHVPISSQTLVFSKTSFQYPKISPEHPRALYYNDDVYVGQVHGGRSLEFVSFDPTQGAIFYVLDEHKVDQPRFERSELDCVQCHVASSSTKGVPGVMLRSVYTSQSGQQAAGTPAFITGQESPIKDRFGGWYVTGSSGSQLHLGNAILPEGAHVDELDKHASVNLADLTGRIDASAYLSNYSDIVAQLVLAHQTQMHNLITQTNYQTRLGLYKTNGVVTEAVRQQFEKPAEQLVRYLLFANEAPLEDRVQGASGFAEEFAARGPRDSQGRSLRDFDLRKRIFKYPCSYLIYSESFDAIPAPAKEFIYHRMFEVLTGRDQGPEYATLSSEDRRAILEILVATKPGLPVEWKQFVEQAQTIDSKQKGSEQQ
jgi:hypothetical protein